MFALFALFTLANVSGIESDAEESRKRAIDFEVPAYFPSDWEAVEAQYTLIKSMPRSTQTEARRVDALYDNIKDAYDSLFRKAIPLYAQAAEDEIISVRRELIRTGFAAFFPKYLRNPDAAALAALGQYEAKDYYKARDTASLALSEYETLFIGARVFIARNELAEFGFTIDVLGGIDKIAREAIIEYEAGNKDTAAAYAREALLRYNSLLKT